MRGNKGFFTECQNYFLFKSYYTLKFAILLKSYKRLTNLTFLQYFTPNVLAPSIFIKYLHQMTTPYIGRTLQGFLENVGKIGSFMSLFT